MEILSQVKSLRCTGLFRGTVAVVFMESISGIGMKIARASFYPEKRVMFLDYSM